MDANYNATEVVPAGAEIGADRVNESNHALVLGLDRLAVIEGDLTALAALARQITAQVAAAQGQQAEFEVTHPRYRWAPASDDYGPGGERAILAVTMVLGGTRRHSVTCKVTGTDPQAATQDDGDQDALNAATGGDGPFTPITVDGHDYAIFSIPSVEGRSFDPRHRSTEAVDRGGRLQEPGRHEGREDDQGADEGK